MNNNLDKRIHSPNSQMNVCDVNNNINYYQGGSTSPCNYICCPQSAQLPHNSSYPPIKACNNSNNLNQYRSNNLGYLQPTQKPYFGHYNNIILPPCTSAQNTIPLNNVNLPPSEIAINNLNNNNNLMLPPIASSVVNFNNSEIPVTMEISDNEQIYYNSNIKQKEQEQAKVLDDPYVVAYYKTVNTLQSLLYNNKLIIKIFFSPFHPVSFVLCPHPNCTHGFQSILPLAKHIVWYHKKCLDHVN